jgi:hypothetical protein
MNRTHHSFVVCSWQCGGLPNLEKSRFPIGNFSKGACKKQGRKRPYKINAIKSACLAMADVLAPLKEKLEVLAKMSDVITIVFVLYRILKMFYLFCTE